VKLLQQVIEADGCGRLWRRERLYAFDEAEV
jgi:hypothetical protein